VLIMTLGRDDVVRIGAVRLAWLGWQDDGLAELELRGAGRFRVQGSDLRGDLDDIPRFVALEAGQRFDLVQPGGQVARLSIHRRGHARLHIAAPGTVDVVREVDGEARSAGAGRRS
jgi:hypothetical protein